MAVSKKEREKITEWATEKAKLDKDDTKLYQLNYEAWLQARIWHYEKMAYLKIHNRESRMKK